MWYEALSKKCWFNERNIVDISVYKGGLKAVVIRHGRETEHLLTGNTSEKPFPDGIEDLIEYVRCKECYGIGKKTNELTLIDHQCSNCKGKGKVAE